MMQNIHASDVAKVYVGQAHHGFAQISSKILLYLILILSSQISVASEVVGEVAKTASIDYFATASGVTSCATAGIQVYSVGKDIKSYTFPNEEEQLKDRETNKKIALIKAIVEFKHCLINNKLSVVRGSCALPTICEEVALILIRCGGEKEASEITAIFNERRKAK